MQFQVGETVRLKSGGPLMTIEEPGSVPNSWVCVWFEGKKEKRSSFAAATLEKDDGTIAF